MIPADERIAVLRTRCLERKHLAWTHTAIPRAEALRASEQVASWQERQGLCTRHLLAQTCLDIDDLELMLGRVASRPPSATDEAIAQADAYLGPYRLPGGQSGHCELHVAPALAVGIDGLVADVRSRLATADEEKAATYRSCLYALEGLSVMIENAAQTAAAAARGAGMARRSELESLSSVSAWVAHHPPRTFREAIQLLWFVLLAVQHGENVGLVGPGHLDRLLHAFYQADLAAGTLTRDEALLYIESLYLLVNEYGADDKCHGCSELHDYQGFSWYGCKATCPECSFQYTQGFKGG